MKKTKSQSKKKQPLTNKQKLFVKEYLISLNATDAARRAGYSKKTAKDIGCQNLAKLNIQKEIQKTIKKREKKLELSGERIVKEHASIGLHNIGDYYNEDGTAKQLHELTRKQLAAVKSFSRVIIPEDKETGQKQEVFITDYHFLGKDKPLEALSKHFGIYEQDHEQQGKTNQEFMAALFQSISESNRGLPTKP
jgi:phage terminase small subunit